MKKETADKNTMKPRAIAFRSNAHIYVQLVDGSGAVLASASSKEIVTGTPAEKAHEVGKEFAKKLVAKKIEQIVFDRNGKRYHGQVKSLADGIRDGGIKF